MLDKTAPSQKFSKEKFLKEDEERENVGSIFLQILMNWIILLIAFLIFLSFFLRCEK